MDCCPAPYFFADRSFMTYYRLMSQTPDGTLSQPAQSRFGLRKMIPRNPLEAYRSASPLELFFDLIFVVAVSMSSATLHTAESSDRLGAGVLGYLMVFFAIWWAWMNFTWFASAFDPDDWIYRVLTLIQMGGVIVLAIGTGPAIRESDFSLILAGYFIMRIALVAQWLRAAKSHPDYRRTSFRYAAGITVVQLCWLSILFAPDSLTVPLFVALVAAELAVPIWAETARNTPWNPEHITDRYGCFTMIVLGESVLASTLAFSGASEHGAFPLQVLLLGISSFILAAGMWWLYFATDVTHRLTDLKAALQFGYGHYFVFAAAGAFSAGVAVLLDLEMESSSLHRVAAAATLTVPVAVFVVGVWALVLRYRLGRAVTVLVPCLGLAIGAMAFTPWPAEYAALLMIALVALIEAGRVRDGSIEKL